MPLNSDLLSPLHVEFEDYGLLANAQGLDQWKTEKPKFPDVLGKEPIRSEQNDTGKSSSGADVQTNKQQNGNNEYNESL